MRYFIAIGLILGLVGCAALAGPLGLAVAGDVSGAITALKDHSDAALAETQSKATLYATTASAIAALVPMAHRYVDHKLKGKK